MCIYSDFWLEFEKKNLAPYAVHSDDVWYSRRGREHQKDTILDENGNRSRYKTAFEIDKDRITNSQAFRRLEYKTQVFVTHEGDNYRTRLTHSLEVAENARHIARSLRLNEHLVEAIALGHDLGHAPYGHTGEDSINRWILEDHVRPDFKDYFFCHNRHSVEVVDHLEPGYDWDRREDNKFGRGLNLSNAVREGILVHTNRGFRGVVHKYARFQGKHEEAVRALSDSNHRLGLFFPGSLEAQVVRVSDDIAQRIHDLEDGLRSGMLKKSYIIDTIRRFFKESENKISKIVINGQSKDPIVFIDQLVTFSKISNKRTKLETDQFIPRSLTVIRNEFKSSEEYRRDFQRMAMVARLLYMWRSSDYIRNLEATDRNNAAGRILKYYELLKDCLDNKPEDTPAYHLIAFLRGIMLANVIEYSFSEMHNILDPVSDHKDPHGNIDLDSATNLDNNWYVVFAVVKGLVKVKGNKAKFKRAKDNKRLICFQFDTKVKMREFLDQELSRILATNGYRLKKLKKSYKIALLKLDRINWINKSEKPEKTQILSLCDNDSGSILNVPIEQIRVYFTGYKELCPGGGGCSLGKKGGRRLCEPGGCEFFTSDLKHPDISRVVDFNIDLKKLDQMLEKLISERLHHQSRIARMNHMGDKIMRFLLEAYLSYPRLMHDRVWQSLRVYQDRESVSANVQNWCGLPIPVRGHEVFSEDILKNLQRNGQFDHNRYTLIRRIIEHIAGMTDRFISNEYNRLHQGGREAEIQDETYFFS